MRQQASQRRLSIILTRQTIFHRMDIYDNRPLKRELTMSVHSSLKGVNKIAAKRNVLKRFERINVLQQRGKWKKGDRAYGLPKIRTDV